jgi:putative AlgH/UPF0301 family transcriptional regulator
VYCGGFTAQNVVHLLHGHNLPGTTPLIPGCFLGGEPAAVEAVAAGKLPAGGFKFLAGAVVWPPGQLQHEIQEGAWWAAVLGGCCCCA